MTINNEIQPNLTKAQYFAEVSHAGQVYNDEVPYTVHLSHVVKTLERFGINDTAMLCAGWLHDSIEDTRVSYNDIRQKFGFEVAELVYAVTNELGRNRKERSEKTYPKMQSNQRALILKLADRIANVQYGLENGGKTNMYASEFEGFAKALYDTTGCPATEGGELSKMWEFLARLLDCTSTLKTLREVHNAQRKVEISPAS